MASNGAKQSNPPMQWRNRLIDAQFEDPAQLLANPFNARIHSHIQEQGLQALLDEVGWIDKVTINKSTQHVVDGHLRIVLAIRRGEWVPTEYVDLTDEEEKKVLLTKDYIASLAGYDRDIVKDLLEQIETDNENLQSLLDQIATENNITLDEDEPLEDQVPQIDKGAELAQRYGTQVGQIWQLGKHRLAIGDSTDKDVIAALMEGEIADLALTDPPYGVEMDKGFTGAGGFAGKGKPIPRRQYSDTWDADRPSKETFTLILDNCKQAIIFGGNFFADLLPQSTHWIVWDKLNTMPTFGDCELAWTNMPRKSVKKFTFEYNGLIGKEKERFHPTQKPLGLFAELLNAYSETGQIILDPFLGSGTTLIAAHQTGRVCYGCELSPEYAAVILQRWETMTGQTATLITPTNTHEIAF